MTIRHRFSLFARAKDGVAYVEFAIALPFLIALFMGAVEVTRYVIIAQKLEKATATISDVIAQGSTISSTQLGHLVAAAGQVMRPYSFIDSNSYIIISSVTKTGTNPPQVKWQYTKGTWTHNSEVGILNNTATLPGGLTLDDKENTIVTEIFYNYAPIVSGVVFSGVTMYKVNVFRPRLGTLNTLGP